MTPASASARCLFTLAATLAFASMACTSESGDAQPTGSTSGSGTGGGGAGATTSSSSSTAPNASLCGGPLEGGAIPVMSSLPALPGLENVRACVNGDAINVTFDPLDGAADYRIYPLPADGQIATNPDGTVTVQDAIYRCAGHREALYMLVDEPTVNDNAAGGTTILNGDVEGFTRAESDATLGYVFGAPGEGRTPVYVLGNSDAGTEGGFSQCGRPVFDSTRTKTYTTDPAKRDALLAAHARDGGIAFYVPAASGATHVVHEGTFGDSDTLRWVDGPEGTARAGKGAPLFDVLTAPAPGALPLKRVHVQPYCGRSHDELVAGDARYEKAKREGDHPLTALRWSGLTGSTVLVVEALDHGCPYQGNLSPVHQDAFSEPFGAEFIDHEAYSTLADMRAASPTGEVFVNGQYEGSPPPKAIARAFLGASPAPASTMDFHATFADATPLEAFTTLPGGNPPYTDYRQNATWELDSYSNSYWHFGTMLGELWFSYNDIAADTAGKIRLTARKKASISATSFLHVTTEVDVISTQRRYPQLIISDQDVPVQDHFADGTSLIIQPKDMTPTHVQLQICDHEAWDVNDQCPMLPTFSPDFEPPARIPGELAGTDNTVKLDAYVSTGRIYLLLDDAPYACVDLPSKADNGKTYQAPSGPVTVTWGDVLYHSGVDFESGGGPVEGNSYLFHRTHMHVSTRRHFDNIGFSSDQAAPAWDEARFPCVKSL